MQDLKPCPFCGGEKIHTDTKQQVYREGGYYRRVFRISTVTATARCGKCFSRGPTVSGKVLNYGSIESAGIDGVLTTKEQLKLLALEAWNRRATP